MSKEIVINKKTNIKNILNKEQYEVLILKCRVNPKKLNEFINVKELVIDYVEKCGCNYNERNLNGLSFKNKLEKLVFKKIYTFGHIEKFGSYIYYSLDLPNLKSIEFPSYMYNYYQNYLEKVENLEEIIFNFNENDRAYLDTTMYTFSNHIKKIVVKYEDKECEIIPEYEIGSVDDLDYDEDDNINIEYSDTYTESQVLINLKNDSVNIDNNFEIHSVDGVINIPDYATDINDWIQAAEKISLNLDLLNHVNEYSRIIRDCSFLRKIELRTNNEMSLMAEKEINVKDYGKLDSFYIEDNLLILEYPNLKISIDNKGTINKINKPQSIEDMLNYFSLEELELYASYLKLLKLSNDLEYQSAMSVIEKKLIKKYQKFN